VIHRRRQLALAWAKTLGSSKPNSNDDRHAWAVQQRVHALVGVAEGILDLGQAWAGKSIENVGKSLIFCCDLRKVCDESNL
jgi:hypothetical protein